MLFSILAFKSCLVISFLGPQWAIFRNGVRFKSCYGVYSYRLQTFVFSEWFNSDSILQFRVCVGWVSGGLVVGGWVGVATDYLAAPVINWTWLRLFHQFIVTKLPFQSFRNFLKTYGPTIRPTDQPTKPPIKATSCGLKIPHWDKSQVQVNQN